MVNIMYVTKQGDNLSIGTCIILLLCNCMFFSLHFTLTVHVDVHD